MRDDGLSLILQTLAAVATRPVSIFIRDDDAGWDDARLLALLDVAACAQVPIDLAVIPNDASPALCVELCRRIDDAPHRLGVHQHGQAHVNHEAQGRKCEFGPSRDAAIQARDLSLGRLRLQHGLGPRLDPIFTPPWNRCAPHTPAVLASLGYVALSRDRSAAAQADLPELPVDVDWSRHHRAGGPTEVARSWSDALRVRATDGRPLGLMLHHAAMGADEFATLARWLGALAHHPFLRWQGMRCLISEHLGRPPIHPTPATQATTA